MKDRITVHNGVEVKHHWTASTWQLSSGMLGLCGWTFFVNGKNFGSFESAVEHTKEMKAGLDPVSGMG